MILSMDQLGFNTKCINSLILRINNSFANFKKFKLIMNYTKKNKEIKCIKYQLFSRFLCHDNTLIDTCL